MARTISEIQAEMLSEKDNQTALSDLNSTSNTALWRLMFYVVAVAIHVFEGLQDVFKLEMEAIANDAIGGTLRWYKKHTLEWQYNHNLEWIDDKFQYNTDDKNARIVTQVSAIETGKQITIKAAKGETGNLTPLSIEEKTSLLSYLNEIKVAGVDIVLTSENADDLKVYYTVYYNSIKSQTSIQTNVESVIDNVLQTLPFDAILKVSALTDAIQEVEGVTDVVFTSASAKYGSNTYEDFSRIYQSNAGYLKIDNAFPLSATINYIPE